MNTNINMDDLFKTIPYTRSLERTADDPAYEPFLAFEDRESYLEWRQQWRDEYADVSQSIRECRKTWRAEGQDHDIANHHRLFRLRSLARAMLELRKASKRKAQALYAASKEASQVA